MREDGGNDVLISRCKRLRIRNRAPKRMLAAGKSCQKSIHAAWTRAVGDEERGARWHGQSECFESARYTLRCRVTLVAVCWLAAISARRGRPSTTTRADGRRYQRAWTSSVKSSLNSAWLSSKSGHSPSLLPAHKFVLAEIRRNFYAPILLYLTNICSTAAGRSRSIPAPVQLPRISRDRSEQISEQPSTRDFHRDSMFHLFNVKCITASSLNKKYWESGFPEGLGITHYICIINIVHIAITK